MRFDSVKRHLRAYKLSSRTSTIAHAFASGLAPFDRFEAEHVKKAMRSLGQDPENLKCVYCDQLAATWDHLVNLVKEGQLQGFGHQVGNLVPACRTCNEQKGKRDFAIFLNARNTKDARKRINLLRRFQLRFAKPVDLARARRLLPNEWKTYATLKNRAIKALREADFLAERLRKKLLH